MKLSDLKTNEELLKKVIRIAEYESELDLGVNPSDFEQAKTRNLSEKDFEYIHKVTQIAEKRLKDEKWLIKTLKDIEKFEIVTHKTKRGIRFDDELFKVGRGILETFLMEKYKSEKLK